MIIIGIAGTMGGGKWAVVDYLVQQYHFLHFSVREYLIKKIVQRGMDVNRDSMFIVANEIREKYGAGFIAQDLYKEASKLGKDAIIESIRTPGEIALLKKEWPFFLLALDADPSLRYERIRSRDSESDHVSYPVFLSNEEREMQSDNPNSQNVRKCITLADHIIINNWTLEELYQQINEVMTKIGWLVH